MLKRAAAAAYATGLSRSWRTLTGHRSYCATSTAVNSMILRSLKKHYVEVSKMQPPPKVIPPKPFAVVKGSLDSNGPVLKRTYKNEEISVYVARLDDDVVEEDDDINQLLVNVDVWKPGQEKALHFVCELYSDELGVRSVSMMQRLENSVVMASPGSYTGPNFSNFDEKMKDALYNFITERGINESLFPFLQAWVYVKNHRSIVHWLNRVVQAICEPEATKGT